MNKVIVFDLDDTLYKEIDYLKSAYRSIVVSLYNDFNIQLNFEKLFDMYQQHKNVFEYIISEVPKVSKGYLLEIYRYHKPDISLKTSVLELFQELKNKGYIIGIITDGRSQTQRNKLKALGIDTLVDEIIISDEFGSEKPNKNNYLFFNKNYPNCKYYYIGDNIKKDFISPNALNWETVGLKDIGSINIHTQKISLHKKYQPNYWVDHLKDISSIIDV